MKASPEVCPFFRTPPVPLIAICAAFILVSSARGAVTMMTDASGRDSITFGFDSIVSGTIAPGGSTPWLTATFLDLPNGNVRLTVTATGFVGNDSLKELNFNFLSSMAAGPLSLTNVSHGGTFGTVALISGPRIDAGYGVFEVGLLFPPGGGPQNRFTSGDSFVAEIMPPASSSGFRASNFLQLAENTPGNAVAIYSLAHVISLDNGDGSVKIGAGGDLTFPPAAPEPDSSLILACLSSAGVLRRNGRR